MANWLNPDGLYLKFGPEKTTAAKAGEYRKDGPMREVELKLTLTELGTASAIIDDNTVIPAGCRVEEVDILNEVAATSGGSAVLNIGLVRTDRTTPYDADGLVAAAALATFNAEGEKITLRVGSTGAGALMGVLTTNPSYIVADYDTAAFTAGAIKVRIRYSVP